MRIWNSNRFAGAKRSAIGGAIAAALLVQIPAHAEAEANTSPLTLNMGNGTSITLYGYVKADFIWDDGFDLGQTTSGIKNIGLPAGGPEGSFDRQQLNETRIGFDIRGPNDFFARVEGDFFGTNDDLRLRHAYVDWYGVIIGQNWTNFMSVENLADTVDFQGSLAQPFSRVPQVRYTYSNWDRIALSASIEEDKTNEDDYAYTLAMRYALPNGMVRASGIYRDRVAVGSDVDGWGVNLATVLNLWQGGTLKADVSTGAGIADVLNAGLTGNAVIQNDSGVHVNSAAFTIAHQVTKKLKLAVTADVLQVDDAFGSDTDKLTSLHLSAFYDLLDNTVLMAEYYKGRRTQGDGAGFSSDRIQLAVKVAF